MKVDVMGKSAISQHALSKNHMKLILPNSEEQSVPNGSESNQQEEN